MPCTGNTANSKIKKYFLLKFCINESHKTSQKIPNEYIVSQFLILSIYYCYSCFFFKKQQTSERLASVKASRWVVWCGLLSECNLKRSTIYSDCSMPRKHCRSRSVSCVATSTQFSCRKCSWDSRTMSSSMLSGNRGSVCASCLM